MSLERANSAAQVLPVLDRLRPARVELGVDSMEDVPLLASVSDRLTTLGLYGADAAEFADFSTLSFPRVERLRVTSFDPVPSFFEGGPELPALEQVDLEYPADSVRWFRGFAHSRYARRVRRLRVSVHKPAAGRALVERPYEALEQLTLRFEPMLSVDYLESPKMLATDVFPRVREVALTPTRHLPALAASPMAPRIERLHLAIDDDEDATLFLAHRARLTRLSAVHVHGDRRLAPTSVHALCSVAREVVWEPRVVV